MNDMRMAIFASLAISGAAAVAAEIDLAGEWRLADARGEYSLWASVPGGVHDSLLASGKIPDVYWGSNETNALWVSRRGWVFERDFEVAEEFVARKEIVLRLEDCDTFAAIYLNGEKIGDTGNRFRRYDFDVKRFLNPGKNTIRGEFRSPVAEADARRAAAGRAYPIMNVKWAKNQALIRKPAFSAGWDWGPEVETIGFCGTVKLIAADKPRIDYIHTAQHWSDDLTHCTLDIFADLSDGSTVTNRIEIDNPPLWWPNGAGSQNMYEFTVDVNGEKITKKIGLRKLEILNERTVSAEGKDELSLVVRVNNRRLFMKGTNWIPCDALERRQTPERYKMLLSSAAAANMNMIRIWGGGQYEKDCFYETCDRLGLLVWHDMMCACAVYPGDETFLGEIRQELAHQLRRLKDYACIALWCGDNECLGAIKWFNEVKDDAPFYRECWIRRSKMQGEMVDKYDPGRTYWPSSPCCGPGDFGDAWKDDSKGDMHQWDVWHENYPFERYYDYKPRFCSEFGYQSFPSLKTAKTFCNLDASAHYEWNDDFEWHQKNPGGNERIRNTMLRYFGKAKDTESELLLSQFSQALAIKTAVEAWRSEMPRCMGTLYWQLDDDWPVSSWSSLEYDGSWKPLHYAARRFYAPVAVFAKPDGSITGVNDTIDAVTGTLEIEHWEYDGSAPYEVVKREVTLAANTATPLGSFDTAKSGFVVLRFGEFQNDWHPTTYRNAPLAKACVTTASSPSGDGIVLSTDKPAFFVWLEGDVEDNLFTLLPGRPVTVKCAGACKAVSLVDTLLEPRLPRVKSERRWRGFNLLDMVSYNEWSKDAEFKQSDFEFLQKNGFNFVRLPLDYRYLLSEDGFRKLDRVLDFGKWYGVHIQICLHRIPGYCSGGLLEGEKDLFSDPEPLAEAKSLWRSLATRYKDVEPERLSFNLFNEPGYMDEETYCSVALSLLETIREIDSDRLVIADGLGYGRLAPNTLLGTDKRLGFGWHCYDPFFITHHKTPWNDPSGVSEPPRWPVDEREVRTMLIEDTFSSKGWDEAVKSGAFIYVGEFGVYKETPHGIALAMIEEQLKLWQELGCGWALWGLYGGFGIMDSGRDDVEYEDFNGHKLDRRLLELLKKY